MCHQDTQGATSAHLEAAGWICPFCPSKDSDLLVCGAYEGGGYRLRCPNGCSSDAVETVIRARGEAAAAEANQITYHDYLRSEQWEKRRKAAMRRAGKRCQVCAADYMPLHVHHNSYECVMNEEPADLVVLCAECHALFHGRMPSLTDEQVKRNVLMRQLMAS